MKTRIVGGGSVPPNGRLWKHADEDQIMMRLNPSSEKEILKNRCCPVDRYIASVVIDDGPRGAIITTSVKKAGGIVLLEQTSPADLRPSATLMRETDDGE